MNRFKIAVVVLLTAGGGSYARAQPPDTTGAGQYTAFVDSGGRRIQIVRNANDCAPFLAEAVWSQGTSLPVRPATAVSGLIISSRNRPRPTPYSRGMARGEHGHGARRALTEPSSG